MNTLKVLYNNKTKFIESIALEFNKSFYVELYNFDIYKSKSKIRKMQENFGSKNYPLIIIEDENLIEIDAIYSENNPDWKLEIYKKK